MNILKTLAVSALLTSTAFAASTTKLKNTSTTSTKKSVFASLEKNFDLKYTARLRGASLSDPTADERTDAGALSGARTNNIRNRIDFKYNFSNGDKILLRNNIYTTANQRSTMSNPHIGYEHSFGDLWTRFSTDIVTTEADKEAGKVVTPTFVGVYGFDINNRLSAALIPWAGFEVFDNNKAGPKARGSFLGNEIDLMYKVNDKYTAKLIYELEYIQQADQNAVTEMAFSYSQFTALVDIQLNKKLILSPGLQTNAKKIDADTTALYGELSYTLF